MIPGLTEIDVWDNRDVTSAKHAPRRLLVIGGGVIGVEMAQAWRQLGSEQVTVVEVFDRLLAREEPFVGAELERSLTRSRRRSRRGAGGNRPAAGHR